MQLTSTFETEKERLNALASYSILDTLPEEDYDNITAIASEICGTPISLVSLVDEKRQWFKSHHGLSADHTDIKVSFCAHAIKDPQSIFVVKDAREDERFKTNSLVTGEPNIVFYAGVPLVNKTGIALGTLCVIDKVTRTLTEGQIRSLTALAKQVMQLLELRKTQNDLDQSLIDLNRVNVEMNQFAQIAAHDLKAPLHNISTMANLLRLDYGDKVDEEGRQWMDLITNSTEKLKTLIDGLLAYSKTGGILSESYTQIPLSELQRDVSRLFSNHAQLQMNWQIEGSNFYSNRTALEQILINLISNAIKYNDKELTEISITLQEDHSHYIIQVSDNGPGISEHQHTVIFKIFEVLTSKDRFGQRGNGIGLATVKKLAEALHGEVRVESELGKGATFNVRIKKDARIVETLS